MKNHPTEMRPPKPTAYAKRPHCFQSKRGNAMMIAPNTCLQYQLEERPCLKASIRSPDSGAFLRTGENRSSSHTANLGGWSEFSFVIFTLFLAQVRFAIVLLRPVGSHGLYASPAL